MAIEPGIIDANVLVYAMDADATHHDASRALLEAALEDSTPLYVTSKILCEFYSIVTNSRRVLKPRSSADAVDAVNSLMDLLHVLPTPIRAVEGWIDLLRRHPLTGADVFDLQLVATMLANDIQRIYTYNTADFDVFPELTVNEP